VPDAFILPLQHANFAREGRQIKPRVFALVHAPAPGSTLSVSLAVSLCVSLSMHA
jgi:hypothetical protein